MLKFNFKKICKIRGIDTPYTFLVNAGFHSPLASRMGRNAVRSIRLDTLEKACLVFNCTPNDLLEWYPTDAYENDEKHALNAIKGSDPEEIKELTELLHQIPIEQLKEVKEYIKRKQNE